LNFLHQINGRSRTMQTRPDFTRAETDNDRGAGCGSERDGQLPCQKVTYLNIDLAQMGVGGDNSWGATAHEPCLPDGNENTYRYRLLASEVVGEGSTR